MPCCVGCSQAIGENHHQHQSFSRSLSPTVNPWWTRTHPGLFLCLPSLWLDSFLFGGAFFHFPF
ncbi:hypothetical protein BDW42DRAFT_161448 [Aspergillus taichungensis]|uniref:Uncharacterized protein n=1 Tax=Aspergillus taichungensis TaxID=482145 RepID=A0A2J5I5D8_9EURO|nr:hypothetical protein BDW42DRAFT_161448 [Aspergillus taichungensis]